MIVLGMALVILIGTGVGALIGTRRGHIIAWSTGGFFAALLADGVALAYSIWIWNHA